MEAMLRLLGGEPLEALSRELVVSRSLMAGGVRLRSESPRATRPPSRVAVGRLRA